MTPHSIGHPLRPGDRAPNIVFDAISHDGKIALDDFRGRTPLLVGLFRGLHCPFCRRHVAAMANLNPALKEMYTSVGGTFVDVTKATGAYTPLEQTTTLEPYGAIPVAVAEVCRLTAYCSFRDIHPNREGYGIIADLIAKTLPHKH